MGKSGRDNTSIEIKNAQFRGCYVQTIDRVREFIATFPSLAELLSAGSFVYLHVAAQCCEFRPYCDSGSS